MAKKYRTVSLPTGIADDIEELIEKLGYWPSVGAFVREATIKMVTEWKDRLMTEDPDRAESRGTNPAPETASSKDPGNQDPGHESPMRAGEAETRKVLNELREAERNGR